MDGLSVQMGGQEFVATDSVHLEILDSHRDLTTFRSLPIQYVKFGNVELCVAIQGSRLKPAIFTLHDIGQNHLVCFEGFFSYYQVQPLLSHFCVYHINFPGQEENARPMAPGFAYPTMDDMVGIILELAKHFEVTSFIGFGAGAGANVFLRTALKQPRVLEGMVLINATCSQASWSEWGYQKMNSYYLSKGEMAKMSMDYLVWYHFGVLNEATNPCVLADYRLHLQHLQTGNLAHFVDAYTARTAINLVRIDRSAAAQQQYQQASQGSVECPVLLLVGGNSPHLETTIHLNTCLDPALTCWMKLSESHSLVLDDEPNRLANAFVLFCQGLGYALKVKPPAISALEDKYSSSEITGMI